MSTQAAAPTAQGQQPEQESTLRKVFGIAQQAFIFWTISQLASKYLFSAGPKTTVQPATTAPDGTPVEAVDPRLFPPAQANLAPAWGVGQELDMHVYFTSTPLREDEFSAKWMSAYHDAALPNFVWQNITFGDYSEARVVNLDIKFPSSVRHNGSLWADVYLSKNGANPNPNHEKFNADDIHHSRKLLTPYLARTRVRKVKSLLNSNATEQAEEEEPDVILPHWSPNVTFALVSDDVGVPYATLPPPMREHVHLVPETRDESGRIGFYKPIVFPNEFWHLRAHYIEINSTTTSLPVQIVFQPMSFFKFQIFASMNHGFAEAAKQQGGAGSAELDEVKRMLLETNPWFLGLTALVSVLHMVFEMLAFKSDVSHWRQKKEMVGVSVRTIVTNVFVQIVILLYLIDNNDNTSWMILFGSGVGVLIEAWKITKAVDIAVVPAPGSVFPYKLQITDKHVLSEDEKKTQEYDKLAFRYVSYVTIPLLAGYTVYSLLYESHRGWYSFIISTLTSFVYMFGFAQLVPQLIINYKLKSVAHMPMKAMIYKTLSTVVDDFFAFCIKMPFLHRLACFRDDVVFLIFLYQRWIYRIDPKRINEYGQVLAGDVDAADSQGETKKTR
ncbi:cleft lip and palate associated transmembrane protein [Mycena amicta]|nr:cleft lip and palate associated transmembrane protein [Mycena amicta]